MDLFVVSINQFGGLADALGVLLGDRLQQLQICRTEEPTGFGVRSEIQHWLGVVERLALLCSLDLIFRAPIEVVAFADGERGQK